ncbi:MAG: tetratricopeptide repeat protein [Gemmataceae bacterium]|nr:tetratricopeptide repeat protein [Gemmataceae bacterium]
MRIVEIVGILRVFRGFPPLPHDVRNRWEIDMVGNWKRALRRQGLLALACCIGFAAPASAQTKTAPLPADIAPYNKLTGGEPMEAALKVLLADKDKAKKVISEAIPFTKDPGTLSYNGAYVLALAATDMKDLKAAEPLFRVCMAQAVKLQSSRKLLQSYGALIDAYFDNKKFDESARICKELLELKTDDGKERVVLTAVTNRFGDIDFVEDDAFDTAKRLRPGVHRLLVQAVAKQGKYDQAIKIVDNLIKVQDHWMERQLKGWVYREAGKFDEAIKTYEDVLERVQKDREIDAEEREHYLERYQYLLSSVYVDAKQIDKAVGVLQKLVEKKPEDPGYANDLGYIMADNDMKLEESEKLVRKAIELDRKRRKLNSKLDPEDDHDNGAYLDSLGWTLFKQKRYKEAKEVMLDALKDKNAQHIEIFDHLADILIALDERQAAVDAWKKGLEFVNDTRRDQERKAAVEKKLQMYSK